MADRFREVFNEKVAAGLSPNEAAAATILELQPQLSDQEASSTKSNKGWATANKTERSSPGSLFVKEDAEMATEEEEEDEEDVSAWCQRSKVWEVFSSVSGMSCAFGSAKRRRKSRRFEERLSRGVEMGRRVLEAILGSGDDKLVTTLKNSLDYLSAELTGPMQGDAEAATAWCVLLEHPDIRSSPALLRTVLVSLGASGPEARSRFKGRALSLEPERRNTWGHLVQEQLTVLAATGADHAELLHAARALDVLAEVDDGLGAVCRETNEVLNERLADDDHLVSQAFHNWLSDEPTDGGGLARRGTSLLNYPYLLDAASKGRFLHAESRRAMNGAAIEAVTTTGSHPYLYVAVERATLVKDAQRKLVKLSDLELRRQLKVAFRGEDGVDEGGVANEFMQLATKELLSPVHGMFCADEEANKLWFKRHSSESAIKFELVGILLGVAIHNSILVDAPFPRVLWRKLVDPTYTVQLADMDDISPATARSLRKIADGDDAFFYATQLCFEASYEADGKSASIDLCEDGASKPVTTENKAQYVDAYVAWYLAFDGAPFKAFERGFKRVAGGRVWRLLTYADLELLVRGSPTLDFIAWKSAAVYEDGYDDDSETIQHFWAVVAEIDEELKIKLLKFVTGSDRAPIGGLGQSRFVISRSSATDQLPSSHTCFHHLILPDYKDYYTTKTKLLIAINESSEGFGLR